MSVFNKLLQALKFDDDYDDYDDYEEYDDDYEDFEEEQPRKSKVKEKVTSPYEDEPTSGSSFKKAHTSSFRDRTRNNDNVTSFSKNDGNRADKMSVSVIRPTTVDDGREICETLLNKRTVILNIEGLDVEIGQRIFDFTYGATYALGGNLQKISNYIFLATPAGVDSVGDLQELFEESMGQSSSMKNRF